VTVASRQAVEIPPNDLSAEHALLGGALSEPDIAALLLERLAASDFYTDAHRVIYGAMLALHRSGHPVDHVSLEARLRATNEFDFVGGYPKIQQLLQDGALAIVANAPTYIGQVREAARKRELLALGKRVTEAALNGKPADELLTEIATTVKHLGLTREDGGAPFGLGLGEFLALLRTPRHVSVRPAPAAPPARGVRRDDGRRS